MLGMISYDKKEDDYKDLNRSVHIDEAVTGSTCYIIHGNLLPTPKLVKAVLKLKSGEFIATSAGNGIVYKVTEKEVIDRFKIRVGEAVPFDEPVYTIRYPWEICSINGWAIEQDFDLLTRKKKSRVISKSNKVTQPGQVFICKGAIVENCIINASNGPVFIGKNAEVMEGCMIRGPVTIGEGSKIKMGAKLYGATTIGPYCIAGGEIKNSVIFGYSNKAHDGYLGDSVIGEWCNLGAGTSNSNLKNNAGEIRIWTSHGEMNAGSKCGTMIADYCTIAINTSINSGTVIGVGSNVYGNGLTPKYIPNFSWGSEGIRRYELNKLFENIEAWKKLKGQELTNEENGLLQ